MKQLKKENKKVIKNLDALFDLIAIENYKSLSFHHHFRNGDTVINDVTRYYVKKQVKGLRLFPSAIFPNYVGILELLIAGQVDDVTCNYLNGPVAEYISNNGLNGTLTMQTHGGRARAIIEGKNQIDIAFIAVPYANMDGDATGFLGPNACGSLGYCIPDSKYARITVLFTDTLVDKVIENPEISGNDVDYIIQVDKVGDIQGIISGTTEVTKNPIGVKIAHNTSKLLQELGVIKNGFSFQSGAGGVSLRVTKDVREIMIASNVKASFFSGGITKFHVEMLEEGLVETLYDVQCFDLAAVSSLQRNKNHHAISASTYANPNDKNMVIQDLDVVILGATEVDLNFNVNVTTDSHGSIIGGSGGHSDTASEAKITVIVSPLIKGRIPVINNQVTTITTLGKHVDCVVTERGIAINPLRNDLIEKLSKSKLNIVRIEDLLEIAHSFTGIPEKLSNRGRIIGVVEDRTFEIIDHIYQK